MSNYEKERQVAHKLVKEYGISNAFAYALIGKHKHLIKENDTVEFAAQKIYSMEIGSNSIITDKSIILETHLMNATLILRGAMGLLQTEHSVESAGLQTRLQKIFYQLEEINAAFPTVFTKKDK